MTKGPNPGSWRYIEARMLNYIPNYPWLKKTGPSTDPISQQLERKTETEIQTLCYMNQGGPMGRGTPLTFQEPKDGTVAHGVDVLLQMLAFRCMQELVVGRPLLWRKVSVV